MKTHLELAQLFKELDQWDTIGTDTHRDIDRRNVMDIIDRIMSLIGGSSGAGIIIATLVGMIKSVWKPKNKKLYWIPASILSVASTVGIFLGVWDNE